MALVYDSGRHQYLNDGNPVPWSSVSNALEKHRALLAVRIEELTASLTQQTISAPSWRDGMRTAIKDAYISHYLAGRGGRNNMRSSDWGRIGGLLSSQYRYLNNFVNDILAGDMSEAAIVARARLYIESATQAAERAKAADRGLVLPAYPGDGTSECMANCKCEWSLIELDTRWEATWLLSAAEHCQTCIERARLWAPLIIEKDL